MTRVAVEFGDPQSATKLRCDAIYAELVAADFAGRESLRDLLVTTKLPASAPKRNLLVVRSGIWIEQSQAHAVNRVRIIGWSTDDDTAWDIASYFHARLLALPGDAEVRSFRYDAGPTRGTDPNYDTPICAATLRASMKPAAIS